MARRGRRSGPTRHLAGRAAICEGGGRTIPVSALGVVRRDEHGEIDWIAMLARDITALEGGRGSAAAPRHPRPPHRAGQPRAVQRPAGAAAARSRRPGGRWLCCSAISTVSSRSTTRFGHASRRRSAVELADRLREITRGRRPGGTGRRRRVRDHLRGRGRPERAGRAGRAGHRRRPAPDRGGAATRCRSASRSAWAWPDRRKSTATAAQHGRSGHVPGQGAGAEPLPHHGRPDRAVELRGPPPRT